MAESRHFRRNELACPCCHIDGTTAELVSLLEHLRSIVSTARGCDTPIYIDSAYRCANWNVRHVNVISHSAHVRGEAADIRIAGMSAVELYRFVLRVPSFTGIGRCDLQAFVHVDVRATPARWCYNGAGAVVPWYEPRANVHAGAEGP